MDASQQALLAIRHVVQEHGDEHYRLGHSASLDAIRWFGSLLGWSWPRSYLDVLAKHDGVVVQMAIVFSFIESVDRFMLLHDHWHRPDGYWPVAGDGCGNYYALAMANRNDGGECPVVFFEMIQNREAPVYQVATNYAEFIVEHMAEQCRDVGCTRILGE